MASLIALLEAGTTPWRREWDAAAGGHQIANLLRRKIQVLLPATPSARKVDAAAADQAASAKVVVSV